MKILNSKRMSSGQAMTETLITASLVLVPLLLLIPLLGKYIDIKHATIQAARYEAWEYTVWYAADSETPDGFVGGDGNDLDQPIKSVDTIQTESRRRFFSATDSTIKPDDGTTPWSEDNRNMLWTDHQGNSLVEGDNPADPPKTTEDTPDISQGIMNIVLDILDAIFEVMAWVMGLIGSDVGFTMINTDGLAKSEVRIPVSAPEGLIDFPNISDDPGVDDSTSSLDIDFVAKASVLTDGWNAGGLGHTINQTGGLVPTKILSELLESLGLDTVFDVVGILAPEWRTCNPSISFSLFPDVNYGTVAKWEGNGYTIYDDGTLEDNGSLWLGYMNIDAIHPDRLDVDDGTHDCPDGICNFDPEPVFADCEI